MPHRDPTAAKDAPVTSRRAFLRGVLGMAGAGAVGAGVVSTLAGCDPFAADDPEPQTHELDAFLLATVALGNQYDATMGAVASLRPLLTPVRDAHRAHAQALAKALGSPVPQISPGASQGASADDPPGADPVPTSRAPALAALVGAEKAGRTEAVAACLAAAGRLAPLLGSIAAARASHLEVLA